MINSRIPPCQTSPGGKRRERDREMRCSLTYHPVVVGVVPSVNDGVSICSSSSDRLRRRRRRIVYEMFPLLLLLSTESRRYVMWFWRQPGRGRSPVRRSAGRGGRGGGGGKWQTRSFFSPFGDVWNGWDGMRGAPCSRRCCGRRRRRRCLQRNSIHLTTETLNKHDITLESAQDIAKTRSS